jgi:Phage integrase family.
MHSCTDLYYEFYDKLVELYYNTSFSECRLKLSLLCLLLILRNGLRVTESIIAVEEFLRTSERVVVIKALKGGNFRFVVFPEEISLLDLYELKQCYDRVDRITVKNVSYIKLKTNPHFLRALFITALYESKIPVERITRIIGHVERKNTETYIEKFNKYLKHT